MAKYLINKQFDSRVERTERVLEIAEAFGLGLDDKKFVVFNNQEFEINQGDVVYITGESGSGKSILLRELASERTKEGLNVINIDQIEFGDKPLIDLIGKDLNHALHLLSVAGLNDANMFTRRPSELSDGQRYRFRLAKAIESGAQVWVADEFLAVLDRTTAKVIAYSLQKTARKMGATLMVATTHGDMESDLAPDLYVNKRYREKIEVKMKKDAE